MTINSAEEAWALVEFGIYSKPSCDAVNLLVELKRRALLTNPSSHPWLPRLQAAMGELVGKNSWGSEKSHGLSDGEGLDASQLQDGQRRVSEVGGGPL
jgi:hypothetical protein